MTDIEILERAENYVGIHYVNGVEDPKINPCLSRAIDKAIAALREQEERENPKPLTLAELREMDGEPVWLHTFSAVQKKTNIAQWAIVEFIGEASVVFVRAGVNSRLSKFLSSYGDTWLAYRHKPKEEL